MRIKFLIAAAAIALLLLSACGQGDIAVTTNDAFREITIGSTTATINTRTGLLTSLSNGAQTISLDGIIADIGYDGAYSMGQLGYTSFAALNTWELPMVYAKKRELPDYKVKSIKQTDSGFEIVHEIGELTTT